MAKKQNNSRAPRITPDQFMQLRFLESRVPGIRFSEDETVLEYFPADSDEQEIFLPDCITTIAAAAFADCANLYKISLPKSLTTIGEEAFRGCRNLREIVIPDNVTMIGDEAFSAWPFYL